MSIQISGSNLTAGLNNTVLSAPYGSLSFNGQNQSVLTSGTGSGANGTILDLTTGAPNWTIEFWIYSSQHSRNSVSQHFLNQGNGQNVVFTLIASESVSGNTQNYNCIQFAFYSTTLGSIYMNSWPTALSLNTWYHVAVCKDTTDGNRYYLYLNGVLVSATPNISNIQVNNGQSYEMGYPVNYITGDNQFAFNGLLSNIRIVKGVALYVTPNVTVPTPPLASTQSLNLSGFNQAITGTQTSLLLTTPYTNIPGSIVLPSTTNVTYPSSSVYNFASNDFTIEFFAYFTTLADIGYVFENWGGVGNRNFRMGFLGPTYTGETGVYRPRFVDGNFNGISPGTSSTSNLTTGIWYHIAFVNSGGTFKLYVNGIADATTATGMSFITSNSTLAINTAFAVSWRLSQLRIVNGTAVYTSNFTPPTSILTSTQSANTNGIPSAAITGTQTAILLNAEPGANFLVDSSSNNFTPTPSSPAPTSASTGPTFFDDSSSYDQLVFGINFPTSSSMGPDTYTGSILFNGTNQYLSIARAAQFNYSTNDFTWEMWIYPTATTWANNGAAFYLIDHGPQNNQGTLHYISNKLVYYNYYNVANIPPYTVAVQFPSLYTISGGSIAANTWTHVAVCRQNLVTRMFLNGKLVSSGPDPYDYAVQSGSPFTVPPITPATQSVTIGVRTDGQYPFKGNISNIRIVNGVSIYNVGNFTPPVRPLPPVQVPNEIGSPSKAVFGSQTSLLMNTSYNSGFLKDSSFNNVTLNQVTTGVFPPSTYTMTSNSPNPFNSNGSIFTPGSIFFNGTSQYLTVPANAALTFGTGDYTVELWAFPTSNSWTSGNFYFWDFGIGTTTLQYYQNQISFYNTALGVGSTLYNSGQTLAVNTWNHIAMVRQSGTLSMFVNGILAASASDSFSVSQATMYIGTSSGGNPFQGYISNFRVVKGAAAYAQSFIPTSGPFTTSQTFNQSGIPSCPVQSSQTSLLLTTPSNSSFLTDSSTNAFTVTNVGTATSEPFNPFTGNYEILANPGSVQLNGTSQYATYAVNSNIVVTANQPFTVEFWIYTPTQVQTAPAIFSTTNNGGQSGHMAFFVGHAGLGIANQYGLYWVGMPTGTGGGGTTTNLLTSTTNYITNTWTHIAIVRSGTSAVTMYINGVANATATYNGAVVFPTNTIWVGTSGDSLAGSSYTGNISNLRWVNGVAVYTANFVTPPGPLNNSQVENQSGAPSAAVTASQTSLLLNTAFGTNFLVDGSINNFIGTNVGTATSATLDPFVF